MLEGGELIHSTGVFSTTAGAQTRDEPGKRDGPKPFRVWCAPTWVRFLSWGAFHRACARCTWGICQLLRELVSGVRQRHKGQRGVVDEPMDSA